MIPSAEQAALAAAAREFVASEIAPHAARWEEIGAGVPAAVLAGLAALGYFGMLVPAAQGGAGLDMLSYAMVTEELAAGDCGLSNLVNVSNSPVCAALRDHGSTAQHARFLAPLARGELRGCFLLTEPHAGSDASAITTRATRRGDRWLLNGTKCFVTAGKSAQLAMIIAVTDVSAGKRGISAFLAPTDAPGYRVTRLEDKLGHRNCDTAEVVLEDLELDDAQLLGRAGDGYRIALAYLEGGRIGVAAQAVGVARAALEAALGYARSRETFGQPILEHQAVGFRLAEMATQLEAARQLTWHAAALASAGQSALLAASMAKAFATAMAEKVCSDALQVHGGAGYTRAHPVEKYYRDARVLSIYEGTNDIQNLVIARALAKGV
ncbi:MAG: acyl-CoA dehydrogenase family protein [Gammaproteobacteria bacterium]|nr:acyl-CoA dehydrogenase family protein [Gammaproteobacteria bacterium]